MDNWSIVQLSVGEDDQTVVSQIRELSSSEMEQIESSNLLLSQLISGTLWNVLNYNYVAFSEFESQLTSAAQEVSLAAIHQRDMITVSATAIVLNYLSAMRMYLDQSEAKLKRSDYVDNGGRFENWRLACEREYDDYFAYRFLSRFRNYVQHVGLPLSAFGLSQSLDQGGQTTVKLLVGESPSSLVEEFNGWSSVEAELQCLTTEINLSDQIHVSMECLNRIEECHIQQYNQELAISVAAFRNILGDVLDSGDLVALGQFSQSSGQLDMSLMQLELERFRAAEKLI